VVHRDLKPENVFLCPAIGGRLDVRVLDFGIAKFMGRAGAAAEAGDATTRTGGILATVWYMSPEQGCGEEVDHRTDIWSLGVLMYEMLSGSRPVEGANYGQVLKRLLNESITPLGVLVPELPADILALVDRMLQRRAEARPQDLREVAEVLGRFTNVMVPPFGPPQPEPILPPDSNPSSVTQAPPGIGMATRSDPYAATDVVGSDEAATSPDPEPVAAPPRSPRRGHAAFAGAAGLAVCVVAGGWSLWSGRRADVAQPVAPTPAAVARVASSPPVAEPPMLAVADPPKTVAARSETALDAAPPIRESRRSNAHVRPPPGPTVRTLAPGSEAPTVSEPRLRTDPPSPDQWLPDHRVAGAGVH
jgi:serine/threonine-protein kinase